LGGGGEYGVFFAGATKNFYMSKKCYICSRIIEDNNRINRYSIKQEYIKRKLDSLYKSFVMEKKDNIDQYSSVIIHLTCYDKVNKEFNDLCGDMN
jgi:hypothetical protein